MVMDESKEKAVSVVDAEEVSAIVTATFESIVDIGGLLPQMRTYLSYRCCGYSLREACDLTPVHENTVRRWRDQNPRFREMDTTRVGELIDKFAKDYLQIEWLRNYRLVLKKDWDILSKSISMPETMSQHDQQYLLKLRGHYTPEQLGIIQKLINMDDSKILNFTQFVMNYSVEAAAKKQVVEAQVGKSKS